MYYEICLPNYLSGAWRHTEGTLLQWTTILLKEYQEHFLRKQSLIHANGQDTSVYIPKGSFLPNCFFFGRMRIYRGTKVTKYFGKRKSSGIFSRKQHFKEINFQANDICQLEISCFAQSWSFMSLARNIIMRFLRTFLQLLHLRSIK